MSNNQHPPQSANNGLSEDTKTIITVLLLIFAFPIGVILMWIWVRWPRWVKILISLVIIIPFVAIFASIIVLIINPLELTHRSRDAVRLSDLANIQKAINETAGANPSMNIFCNDQPNSCDGDSTNNGNVRKTDGTGWVKIKTPSLATLPIDPVNNAPYSYKYCSDGKEWEIQAAVESKQILEKAKNDGGDKDNQYEVGTNLKLCK